MLNACPIEFHYKCKSVTIFTKWGTIKNNSCNNQQHAVEDLTQNIAIIVNKGPWRLLWNINQKPTFFTGPGKEIKNLERWINPGAYNDCQHIIRPGI